MYSPRGVALRSSRAHHVINCVAKEEYYAKHISQRYGGLLLEYLRVAEEKRKTLLEECMSGGNQTALVGTNDEIDPRTQRALYLGCNEWYLVI